MWGCLVLKVLGFCGDAALFETITIIHLIGAPQISQSAPACFFVTVAQQMIIFTIFSSNLQHFKRDFAITLQLFSNLKKHLEMKTRHCKSLLITIQYMITVGTFYKPFSSTTLLIWQLISGDIDYGGRERTGMWNVNGVDTQLWKRIKHEGRPAPSLLN